MPKEIYRSAASVALIRPVPQDVLHGKKGPYQLLLLHKPRKNDAWQLPQGGMEQGETVQEAALRELGEEAGITDVKVLGESEHIYKYDFPTSYRKFRPDHVRGQHIAFIYGITKETTDVKVDLVEVDRFVWAFPEDFHLFIKRKEYITFAETLFNEAVALAESSEK